MRVVDDGVLNEGPQQLNLGHIQHERVEHAVVRVLAPAPRLGQVERDDVADEVAADLRPGGYKAAEGRLLRDNVVDLIEPGATRGSALVEDVRFNAADEELQAYRQIGGGSGRKITTGRRA